MTSEQLPSLDTNSLMPDVASQFSDMLAPIFIASTVLTIIFLALFVNAALRRRKVEGAIFDIQKTLHEMNERDKAREKPTARPTQPRFNTDTIAASRSEGPDDKSTSA